MTALHTEVTQKSDSEQLRATDVLPPAGVTLGHKFWYPETQCLLREWSWGLSPCPHAQNSSDVIYN